MQFSIAKASSGVALVVVNSHGLKTFISSKHCQLLKRLQNKCGYYHH